MFTPPPLPVPGPDWDEFHSFPEKKKDELKELEEGIKINTNGHMRIKDYISAHLEKYKETAEMSYEARAALDAELSDYQGRLESCEHCLNKARAGKARIEEFLNEYEREYGDTVLKSNLAEQEVCMAWLRKHGNGWKGFKSNEIEPGCLVTVGDEELPGFVLMPVGAIPGYFWVACYYIAPYPSHTLKLVK